MSTTTRTERMGQHRPTTKSPRKNTRKSTRDRAQARAFKYAVQGRNAR